MYRYACMTAVVLIFMPAALAIPVTFTSPPNLCGDGTQSCVSSWGSRDSSYPFETGEAYGRVQEIFLSDQFVLAGGTFEIHEISFRPDGPLAGAVSWSNIPIVVRMGTTSLPSFSGTEPFLSGMTDVLGTVSVPALWSGTCPGGAPATTFCVNITLDTPYFYTPATGNNLVVELIKYNHAGGLGFSLDAASDAGAANKWLLRRDGKSFPTDGQANSNAIVATELQGFDMPEPGTFVLFGAGLLALSFAARRFRRN